MTLGDIIKRYRDNNQISMSDFAHMAKLSKAYISILERNYNPTTQKPAIPSLATIKSVASAMNMDFNELLAMLDPDQKIELKKEPATNKDDGLDPLDKELRDYVDRLTLEQKKFLLAQMKLMNEQEK